MESVLPGVMYAAVFEEEEMEKPQVQMMDGFPVKPMLDYIFVADLGQPNRDQSGLFLGDNPQTFARYKHTDHRFGIVCAIGPGREVYSRKLRRTIIHPALAELGLKLGDVVVFNRRFGSRLGLKWQPPGVPVPVFVRVLDPDKTLAIADDFRPWWDIAESVLDPDGIMTG